MKLYKDNYTKYISENVKLVTYVALPIIKKSGERYYSKYNGRLKNISILILNLYKRSIEFEINWDKFNFKFLWYVNTDITPDDYIYNFEMIITEKIVDFLIENNQIDYINSISKKQNLKLLDDE